MSLMVALLVVWAVITAGLIGMMIYRSVVALHEDDQLFLSSGEAQMARNRKK